MREDHAAIVRASCELRETSRKLIAEARAARARVLRTRRDHHWVDIALGRVCIGCELAQLTGEFVDDAPCLRR